MSSWCDKYLSHQELDYVTSKCDNNRSIKIRSPSGSARNVMQQTRRYLI